MPGTDLAGDEGYSSVWYFYCPKRYKNTQGKPSGHRQCAIAGGDACWHSETRPKPVKGLAGATLCNLSYGRKEGSSRSFNRMGWCMTEYDEEGGGDGHVLCKVYRSSSSLAKGKLKLKPSSTSTNPSSSEQAAQCSSASKRKATADHPQARPSKISHAQACASNYSFVDQEFYHQMQEPLFTDDQMGMTMPVCVDYESLFPADEEQEQDTLVTAEMEQLLQNTMALVAAEDEQSQQNTLASDSRGGAASAEHPGDRRGAASAEHPVQHGRLVGRPRVRRVRRLLLEHPGHHGRVVQQIQRMLRHADSNGTA